MIHKQRIRACNKFLDHQILHQSQKKWLQDINRHSHYGAFQNYVIYLYYCIYVWGFGFLKIFFGFFEKNLGFLGKILGFLAIFLGFWGKIWGFVHRKKIAIIEKFFLWVVEKAVKLYFKKNVRNCTIFSFFCMNALFLAGFR